MTAFWIVAAALLVLVSLALILPLWRGEGTHSISRSALNKLLYRQRLLEIDEERDQGVLAEESESLVELQRSLLDDIPDVERTAQAGRSMVWIPGVVVLVVVSLGLYFKLGSWQQVQHWQEANSRFDELSNRILVERDGNVTEQDLQDLVLGLRTRLKEDPEDYRGWALLGRLSLDANDHEQAREALSRAYKLTPEKNTVAVPYAQALMMTGDGAQAELLLRSIIAQEPGNVEARSLHAFMALQNEEFQLALDRWQALLPLLEKGSARYNMVERTMEYARQQLKQRGVTPKEVPVAPAAPQAAEQAQVQTQAAPEAKAGEFLLNVTLAPGILLPEDAHLFVFAVIPNGPSMPIAVKRISSPSFPLSLSIGDADAMTEGNKLSAYPELQFKARLSRGGDVMNKTGAFEGISTTVPTASIASTPIDINIDHPL